MSDARIFPFPHLRNSGRAVRAAARQTSKETKPMPVVSNLHPPHPGEIVEMVDNGRRLAPVEHPPSELARYLARQPKKEPVPLEAESVERVALGLDVARDALMAAMARLDLDREQIGASDLHVRVGEIANEVDDLAAYLAERFGS